MKILLLPVILILIFNSCTYECGKSEGLKPNFISFSEAEIRPIVIKSYQKGSNFMNILDSFTFDISNSGFYKRNDTLELSSSQLRNRVTSDFDHVIFLPSANLSFGITDLNEPKREERKTLKKVYCVSQIISCKINDRQTAISYDDLYLKK